MSASTIKALKEERKDFMAQADELLSREKRDGKTLAADEIQKVDEILEKMEALDTEINRRERLLSFEEKLQKESIIATDDQKRAKDEEVTYKDAFTAWFRSGGNTAKLSPEHRATLERGEKRAQTTQTDSSGGYLIPEGFSGMLEKTMALYGGMLEAGSIWRTATGNRIPWPTVNDTSNVGALIAENTQEGEQDVTFGEVVFNAYKYGSDIVRVPYEAMQDYAFNIEEILRDLFADRLGRAVNTAWTTADGSSKPRGVVTAASSGVPAAAVAAITRPEIVDLIHSVDPAYRVGPKVGFMFNDSTLAAIKKLALGTGDARPLWQPSMTVGAPDRLEGYPYWINQSVADLAASSKSVLFGNFDKYKMRIVGDVRFNQSEHLYFDFDQTAFVAWMRIDGDLIAANAIKYITQAAS